MKELLSDTLLREMYEALSKGESFNYADANTMISVSPNGISIQYQTKVDTKQATIDQRDKFIDYCNHLDDDLFVEVCDTFEDGELENLQQMLDTNKYEVAINTFVNRVKEVASSKLSKVINEADAEIKRQEQLIAQAHLAIEEIHKELEEAHKKYSV
jgi:hypothetical protein